MKRLWVVLCTSWNNRFETNQINWRSRHDIRLIGDMYFWWTNWPTAMLEVCVLLCMRPVVFYGEMQKACSYVETGFCEPEHKTHIGSNIGLIYRYDYIVSDRYIFYTVHRFPYRHRTIVAINLTQHVEKAEQISSWFSSSFNHETVSDHTFVTHTHNFRSLRCWSFLFCSSRWPYSKTATDDSPANYELVYSCCMLVVLVWVHGKSLERTKQQNKLAEPVK